MSFAYLPLFTGDYLRDTRHLTPLRHGVYLLSLMHCWDSSGPMPLDEQDCAGICNCRSSDEIDALRYVLGRYFVKMEDGWYNKRMMMEIERSNVISGKRSGAAHKRWEARQAIIAMHDANAMQMHSKSNASGTTPSPSPSLTSSLNQEKKSQNNRSPSAPDDVCQQVWEDWKQIRKAKKSPVTDTAIKGIRAEAKKAGLSFEDALRISCERGWAGFKAEWVSKQAVGGDKYAAQAERVIKLLDGEIFDAK